MSRAVGVIPARYRSTRFPGKPLAPLGDATMLEVVWRRVASADALSRVIVATDDARIADAARGFDADVMMTDEHHPSGTDRVAEVVRRLDETFDVVVNVQGDEPLVTPGAIDRLVRALDGRHGDDDALATLAEPLTDADELGDPNVVKLVAAPDGRALYFSRAPIPHVADGEAGPRRKHQGLYAYTPAALERLTALPPSPLERAERLEQLRALEHGFTITVVDSDFRSHGVDTPRDLDLVARALGLAEAT